MPRVPAISGRVLWKTAGRSRDARQRRSRQPGATTPNNNAHMRRGCLSEFRCNNEGCVPYTADGGGLPRQAYGLRHALIAGRVGWGWMRWVMHAARCVCGCADTENGGLRGVQISGLGHAPQVPPAVDSIMHKHRCCNLDSTARTAGTAALIRITCHCHTAHDVRLSPPTATVK